MIAATDAERLKEIQNEWGKANNDRIRAICVEQFRILAVGDFDFRPMLAKRKVPVLVIEGENTNVPLDATREWAKAAPKARLLLVPDAGHWALPENPGALREIGTS